MLDAVIPIFGIRRNAQTVRRAGQEIFLDILGSLRNSELGNVSYNRIIDLRYLDCGAETGPPPPPGRPGRKSLGTSI